MFRADPARTGEMPGPGPDPAKPIVTRWSFETEKFISSSPAIAEGKVYVGSRDGTLYAVDAENGKPRWTFELGYTDSSPAVIDGVVYAGNSDNSLYAIDAATGQQIWALEIGGDITDEIVSSPAVVDGVVYAGSTDGHVYAVDAATGQELWSAELGDIAASPAVVDGVVYVSTRSLVLYALDAKSGDEKWVHENGDLIFSYRTSPAVADGMVYLFSNYDNDLHAIDTETGTEAWDFDIEDNDGASIQTSPAVAGGVVYAGGTHRPYAIDAATGQQIWNFPPEGRNNDSSPVVADGVVYVATSNGNIYAIDAPTGRQVWSRSFDADIVSSPAVAGGMVYIGIGGTLYAFANLSPELQTATVVAQITATAQANLDATATAVQADIDATSIAVAQATATGEAQAMATQEAIQVEWNTYFWTDVRDALASEVAEYPGVSIGSFESLGPGSGGEFIPSGFSRSAMYPIIIAGGSASATVTLAIYPSKDDADSAMESMSGGLIRSGWESQDGKGLDHNHACLTIRYTERSEALCYMTRDDVLIVSYSSIGLPNPDAALLNAVDLANAMNDAYDEVDRPD
jgi:outer membrane protein assembly factor BamB